LLYFALQDLASRAINPFSSRTYTDTSSLSIKQPEYSRHLHSELLAFLNCQSATMPSAQEIASKVAQISAQLTVGGTNAQMKKWYNEYKKLLEELKAAKAIQPTAPKTTCHGNPDDT
jgi:hypothetical protein